MRTIWVKRDRSPFGGSSKSKIGGRKKERKEGRQHRHASPRARKLIMRTYRHAHANIPIVGRPSWVFRPCSPRGNQNEYVSRTNDIANRMMNNNNNKRRTIKNEKHTYSRHSRTQHRMRTIVESICMLQYYRVIPWDSRVMFIEEMLRRCGADLRLMYGIVTRCC